MVVFGIDAHKKSHTVVAVDEQGRQLGTTTVGTSTEEHRRLLAWAKSCGKERLWAVEDCRCLSRRLEHDLLSVGERIVRVSPKMMAGTRRAARTYGKSDPIDALAVARTALREPDLPAAALDGKEREIRLLVDHREDLVSERTRVINRLRWHLHEINPDWDIPKHHFTTCPAQLVSLELRLAETEGTLAQLATELVERCICCTKRILELNKALDSLVRTQAPSLVEIPGCGTLTAAKIIAETAGVLRFRGKDAYARYNGTAPLPVWSSNTERFRLSRSGNRQLNAALYRIALTQSRYHPGARAYLERRQMMGNTKREGVRALKRRLSDVVYAALMRDARNGQMESYRTLSA